MIKNVLKKIKPAYRLYRFIAGKVQALRGEETVPEMQIKRKAILDVAKRFPQVKIFIETGTFLGDTIDAFKEEFNELYSIELSNELAQKAILKFNGIDKIDIRQGNSNEQLSKILKDVNGQCLFWLDGHYSSEFWVGEEYIVTSKGDKTTPILEELLTISQHHISNHVILIDDARLFNGNDDYPKLSQLKKNVKARFPQHSFQVDLDIIRLLPTT